MPCRSQLSVLLATEGTYPFYRGGVSTWCHRLTYGLPEIEFRLLAVVTNPFPPPQYEMAPNVTSVLKIPQWGLHQPAEYSVHQPPSVVLHNRWGSTPAVIARRFKPLFERFLALVFSPAFAREELGDVLLQLHHYFQQYDYQKTMNSPEAWSVLQHVVRATWEQRPHGTENPSLAEVKQAYRLLYHLMMVLHAPIPRADIAHSSAAGFCGLPCVLAKLAHGTPYLLTEHGVYLREQYLNLRRYVDSFFVRWFLYRLVSAVVLLNYHFADQVSPVCAYNSRWERKLGVPQSRIQVIFNGVDPTRFHRSNRRANERPVVGTIGLIYNLKGQLDLIEAAGLLQPEYPNLDMRFYGSPSDYDYYDQCKRRITELGLEDNVTFAGSTQEPWKVYNDADVVAFSSISEGFPYVVVEAMLCGATIIATDVGGVREAIGDCGLLVSPKAPQEMAAGIARLLADQAERQRLGHMAEARALELYTEETFLASHESTYYRLAQVPRRFSASYAS